MPRLDDEWKQSEERTVHLTTAEKWVMRTAVITSSLAIAMFTWTKWEVERRIKEELSEEDQKREHFGA